MDTLTSYRKGAIKIAVVTELGGDEGYAALIPRFPGLLATGRTRKQALAELEDALADWIDLALKRGLGLPALGAKPVSTLTPA